MHAQTTHEHTLRVYFEDTDVGGIVYYANYLKFFERARTEWMRAIDLQHSDLMHQHQLMLVVVSTEVKYLRAAHLDDLITVRSSLTRVGAASATFSQEAVLSLPQHDVILAKGTVKIGAVNIHTLKPFSLPDYVINKFKSIL